MYSDPMTDRIAKLYGYLPQHPGKWRIIHALLPVDRPHEWRVAYCNGIRIWVDIGSVMGEHLYYGRMHERWETTQVRRHLKPGDVALDVGANIGYYSLLFSRLVGAAGKVYAFEPAEQNLNALRRNLAEVSNVAAVPVALSDQDGFAQLGGTTADTLRIGYAEGTSVKTMRLDTWAAEVPLVQLDFLKMDIEGHEIPMLRGGEMTIRRLRPTILLEASIDNQQACGHSIAELRDTITDLGYRPFLIKKRKLIPWTTDTHVDCGVLAVPRTI
jgi:FkbM family methyltransferase